MNKFTRLMSLSIALLILVFSFGIVGAQDLKIVTDGAALGPSDVPTLDPAIATDSSSIAVIANTFAGLIGFDEETLEIKNGMGSMEISEDGLTYTFSIRNDVPWVEYDEEAGEVVEVTDEDGNVRMVTAADFAYTIQRTLDPATAADYAFVLYNVVAGGEAFNLGEGAAEDLGLEVVDDQTLVITVPAATGYLRSIFTMWQFSATPSWLIEEVGAEWIEDENFQSYGPFTLKEWNHDQSVILIKNPFYPGTDYMRAAQVDEVHMFNYDSAPSLAEFEAGNLDVAAVPSEEIDRILADAELSQAFFVGPSKYTYYYGFNVEKEPFNDARVRRAFSMAIDRQGLIDNILKGGQEPAGFFTRPDVAGGPTQANYDGLGITSDPEAAKAELQSYLDEKGITVDQMPAMTLAHNESAAHAAIATAIQQMWAETLGVNVEISSQEWGVYLETLSADAPQIWRLGWGWDYPDANSFVYDVFHSSSGNNNTNWSNAEFDALIEEARLLNDNEARKDLYAQAEHILVNTDAAVAPIYFYTTLRMNNPALTERTYSLLGFEVYAHWNK